MNIKNFLSLLLFLTISMPQAKAVAMADVRFHNESTDTTRINQLLAKAIKIPDAQERIATIGQEFIGTPYVAGTLEGDKEYLTINLDEMDCTTFVETVLALAYTAGEGRSSWRDYIYNLEQLRYRNGTMNGYASRLHYVSDWIVDNVHRGMFVEATNRLPKCDYTVKSIDFMSENREKYPGLKDSVQFERVKSIEMGYCLHRFPYIKKERLNNKEVLNALKNGDIIAITTKIPGLDATHMGIIIKDGEDIKLLHASSTAKKVEISLLPLYDYLRRNKNNAGIRVVRLSND